MRNLRELTIEPPKGRQTTSFGIPLETESRHRSQCPGQDSNLHGSFLPRDFKSLASAVSPPGLLQKLRRAGGRAESVSGCLSGSEEQFFSEAGWTATARTPRSQGARSRSPRRTPPAR